ncbi:TPA: hypothetical protein L4936_001171 [Pseudomonas aeruginosa]|nr:hypothetical protein [Pseudomonas aeruginosa]HBO7218230.1 hypothetical protein [Pseudomonas aeruginosa]
MNSLLVNIIVVVVTCFVVFYLSVALKLIRDCIVSVRDFLQHASARMKAHSIKPGTLQSARLTKRETSVRTSPADAAANNDAKPMAVRIKPVDEYAIYDVPTYVRRGHQLSF